MEEGAVSKGYYQITDGEWIQVPKRGFKEQCCSCGLVHKVNFRVNDKGQFEIQTFRDERATAAVRRAFNFSKDD